MTSGDLHLLAELAVKLIASTQLICLALRLLLHAADLYA